MDLPSSTTLRFSAARMMVGPTLNAETSEEEFHRRLIGSKSLLAIQLDYLQRALHDDLEGRKPPPKIIKAFAALVALRKKVFCLQVTIGASQAVAYLLDFLHVIDDTWALTHLEFVSLAFHPDDIHVIEGLPIRKYLEKRDNGIIFFKPFVSFPSLQQLCASPSDLSISALDSKSFRNTLTRLDLEPPTGWKWKDIALYISDFPLTDMYLNLLEEVFTSEPADDFHVVLPFLTTFSIRSNYISMMKIMEIMKAPQLSNLTVRGRDRTEDIAGLRRAEVPLVYSVQALCIGANSDNAMFEIATFMSLLDAASLKKLELQFGNPNRAVPVDALPFQKTSFPNLESLEAVGDNLQVLQHILSSFETKILSSISLGYLEMATAQVNLDGWEKYLVETCGGRFDSVLTFDPGWPPARSPMRWQKYLVKSVIRSKIFPNIRVVAITYIGRGEDLQDDWREILGCLGADAKNNTTRPPVPNLTSLQFKPCFTVGAKYLEILKSVCNDLLPPILKWRAEKKCKTLDSVVLHVSGVEVVLFDVDRFYEDYLQNEHKTREQSTAISDAVTVKSVSRACVIS